DLVVQIEFNGDDIPFGKLAGEDVGISHGQCPGLSLFGLERDRPLALIDRHDLAPAEDGGLTGRDHHAHRDENPQRNYDQGPSRHPGTSSESEATSPPVVRKGSAIEKLKTLQGVLNMGPATGGANRPCLHGQFNVFTCFGAGYSVSRGGFPSPHYAPKGV